MFDRPLIGTGTLPKYYRKEQMEDGDSCSPSIIDADCSACLLLLVRYMDALVGQSKLPSAIFTQKIIVEKV